MQDETLSKHMTDIHVLVWRIPSYRFGNICKFFWLWMITLDKLILLGMTLICPCGWLTTNYTKSFLQPAMQKLAPCWSARTSGQSTTTPRPALLHPPTQPGSNWQAAQRRSSPAATGLASTWRAGATGRTTAPMRRMKPNAKLSSSPLDTIHLQCRHLLGTKPNSTSSWKSTFGISLKSMKRMEFSDAQYCWHGNGLIKRLPFKTFKKRQNSTL